MTTTCTAFDGMNQLSSGKISTVIRAVKLALKTRPNASILVFDNDTGKQIELDLRAESKTPVAEPPAPPASPGRPKLGVVAREVTLLPRQWEWLAAQPGGASVALRKVVDEARKTHADRDAVRHRQEVTYRFISAVAGNLPGFEEVSRALFANDASRFTELMTSWPNDIRKHALKFFAL